MNSISFGRKLVTCILAGLVIGASALRIAVTYFANWGTVRGFSIIPYLTLLAAIICAIVWQTRKTNNPSTLAFWQALIRYGVAFDLAEFGWAKIFHQQLVIPLSRLDLPYNSFSSSDLFWTFFSHSYLFGCIIASLQIGGAMLLLFHRTRLVGVFVLLPVLANILLMDIFYNIGYGVAVHASIMMAGVLYFLVIEFNRLKAFFFETSNRLPELHLSKYAKWIIRLSIIYIPLLLIALHGKADKHPELTGKYAVKQLSETRQLLHQDTCAQNNLTTVYFDIKSDCVFQFGQPAKRWNGRYSTDSHYLKIKWVSPADKPTFIGAIPNRNSSGEITIAGMLGQDSVNMVLQKLSN